MKTYKLYKDSGIEWLGAVPYDWQILRLKSLIIKTTNGVWGSEPEENENDLICVRVADFDMYKFGVSEEKLTTRNIPTSQQDSRLLSKDNLLIEKSGGGEKQTVGRVIKYDLDKPAVCSNFIAKIDCNINAEPNYLVYLFSYLYSIGVNTRSIKQTTGIQNLDTELYFNERVSVPAKNEQTTIASFLDQKTQQIDDLIAKKQRLIELLKEERTAVINQAVTKGKDPTVPMKDSGIEWLGEIPEHWEVKSLKRICNIQGRIGFKGYTKDDLVTKDQGALTLGAKHIDKNNQLDISDPEYIKWDKYYESPEIMVKKGDVLVTQRGSLGKVAIIEEDIGEATINPSMVLLNQLEISGKYLYYFLNSNYIKKMVDLISSSTAVPMISQEELGSFYVLVPELNEQTNIADYLIQRMKSIDNQIILVQNEINLINEYKTSLINEAVTGKIDVRDYKEFS